MNNLDGDHGVYFCRMVMNVKCVAIEHNHGTREERKIFPWKWASVGAATPLTLPRQGNVKNIEESLKLNHCGIWIRRVSLTESIQRISIPWNGKNREPKPIGKGKITGSEKTQQIAISDIKKLKLY